MTAQRLQELVYRWWHLLGFGRVGRRGEFTYNLSQITMVLFQKFTYLTISHQNLYYQLSSNHHYSSSDFYSRVLISLSTFTLAPL